MISDKRSQVDPAYRWTVETFGAVLACFSGFVFAFLAAADPSITAMLLVATLFSPIIRWRNLVRNYERKRYAFLSELPIFLHKMSLLMAAGEPIQRAWQHAGVPGPGKQDHPLYAELTRTNQELRQGVPFPKALEDLHRRCEFHEIGSLITTVLMNYRRGGEAFALALQDASRLLMEKKQTAVRTQGEVASTKLLFPMLLMLGAVMLMVAAPAVMMLN